MPRKGSQALTDAEAARVRAHLVKLLAKHDSQRALAEALGVTGQAISRVVQGQAPGVHLARAVARALGVGADALLSGADEPARVERGSLRAAPRWRAAADEAARRWPHLREWIEITGDVIVPSPATAVSPEWLADLAHVLSKQPR